MSTRQKNASLMQYREAALYEGTKEWFVYYYAHDPASKELKRKKIKLNHIKNIRDRRAAANRIIKTINKKLSTGWSPFVTVGAEKCYAFVFEALDKWLRYREKEAETHSLRSYRSFIRKLKDQLIKHNFGPTMQMIEFTPGIGSMIMEDLREEPKISLRTWNNYLSIYGTIFNWMIEHNYTNNNPFIHIKKVPRKKLKKMRRPLTAEECLDLQRFLLDNGYTNYLAMCYLCYYCCIRPNEISLLRVKDISLSEQCVYISSEIAKNDNDSVRIIPDVAMWVFEKLNLSTNKDYYLFGFDSKKTFAPGPSRAEGREIARFWNDVIRKNLKWPLELQFYSLKDTGITQLLEDGVAPNYVQGQADHSSLAITSIYASKVNREAKAQLKKLPKAF